jgi:hypothetical protein
MIEIGYRFALAGRAAESQSFELAGYEIGVLREALAAARAAPRPADVPKSVNLDGLRDAFLQKTLPPLEKAARARDLHSFRNAYAAAVVQCNGCHRSAGKPFLKVPAIAQGATFLDLRP